MNSKSNNDVISQNEKVEKIHGPVFAWIILASSLILTVCAWFISTSYIEKRASDKFAFKAEEIAQAIEDQMLVYEQVLRGGVAFFDSSEFVSREEWKNYVAKLNISKHWPGIQGLGYSVPVKPQELEKHLAAVRAEGFPEFTVKPEGPRELYTSIIYLEPFDWRNKRAFGYDMWSNDMRREAMKKSVETGKAIASGLITLVQETEKDVQKGFLLYFPVYKKAMPLENPEQRMSALQGWVYAAFRTKDLMKGILSSRESGLDSSTEMEIYDSVKKAENLLYSSSDTPVAKHAFYKEIELDIQGRKKVICIYENEGFKAEGAALPKYIAIGGVIIDLLLFYVIFALASVQKKAVNIAQDISGKIEEKNDALEKLNNSLIDREEKIKAIVDNTVDGIITIDSKGIIQTYNKSCIKLMGYTPEEVIGQNIKILIPEPHKSKHDEYLKRFLETREAKIIGIGREVDCLRKDGTTFPADLSISIAREGKNEVFIGTIHDITSRKKQENKQKKVFKELKEKTEQLEIAKEEAILASKSKSEFLANMSHEIRTPMTAILGYIDLLKENISIENLEAAEQINVIERNGEYLLNIINDILDLSKIEAGKLELEYAPMDVFSCCSAIKNLLSAKLLEKNLEFKIEYDFPIPKKVNADLTRVRQILINLLGNSIKFTQKGHVILRTSWNAQNSKLVFTVQDTGIGMTQEQLNNVFQSFVQADNSITRKFGGTGLGLAITKRLTEMMGGKVRVESEYGKGTSFFVEIKAEVIGSDFLQEAPNSQEKTIVKLDDKSTLSGRVLLVDDNMTNLTLISKILKKMQLDIECCMNGQEAVNLLLKKEDEFQIVLMDVQMPVMDGLTAVGILRQNDYTKPVIALTANTMSGDKEKCLAAGYSDFASKPINKAELFRILKLHLSS